MPWVEVEREPMEEEGHGPDFHFFDVGYFDTRQAAYDRGGVAWAKAWLESNY
jgi:hypothetical protein